MSLFSMRSINMPFSLRALQLSGAIFGLLLSTDAHASTTAPLFGGSTLTIQGVSYIWTSPATEDGTWHNDTYTNATGQTVTASGKIGSPNLATVSGTSPTGTVDGHLQNGTYGDKHTSFSGDGSWQVNGVTYTHRENQVDYTVDFENDRLTDWGQDNYSGPNGNYQSNVSISDSFNWWNSTGGTTPNSGHASYTLFGSTYVFSQSSAYFHPSEDSDSHGWADNYVSAEGGTLKISRDSDISFYAIYLDVWDPHVGSVKSQAINTALGEDLSGVPWAARPTRNFAQPQVRLDGRLLNWTSGSIESNGNTKDTYKDAGNTTTLTVQAGLRDYQLGNTSATVNINGVVTGAFTTSGGFTGSGHVIQNATYNRGSPLFTENATVIGVNTTQYRFVGGYEDSYGARIDVYTSSSGARLTITGNTADAAHGSVAVNYIGVPRSGTYSSGVFHMTGVTVTALSNQTSVYGPPAFWVRGELYLRSAATSTTFASAAEHSLTFTGYGTSWTLAGEDATGAFSGTSVKDPVGVFVVQDAQGATTVPVLPANADGSLHLSWSGPPSGLPPALIENTHILAYLGTAADDTSPAATAAYYGSATASNQSPWLVKLRTDGSSTTPYTVTYTDYSTATSSTGSYNAQTHLFQSWGLSSGFPVPVYAVDPSANYALWNLSQPDSATGLPATFLVQGNVWRYAGTNGSGAAVYQGYYSSPETGSQLMTVAAPDANGGRVVTVTDPFHGDGSSTHGTLNDVRGSVRLRDGSEVYSGNFSGQQVNPTLNPNNLHTIAADLDITGNVITFGSLTGNAATAGVTLQFQDTANDGSYTGSFYSMLARPQAQWLWARTASSSGQSTLPVMKLDATHKLTLYDSPANGQTQNAGVVLDPKTDGVSTIRGTLRVRPGGDIDMGDFMVGGQP